MLAQSKPLGLEVALGPSEGLYATRTFALSESWHVLQAETVRRMGCRMSDRNCTLLHATTVATCPFATLSMALSYAPYGICPMVCVCNGLCFAVLDQKHYTTAVMVMLARQTRTSDTNPK